MKSSLVIALLCLLCAPVLHGEEVLARRLSVTFHETPLKSALDEIAKLAEFEWSYNAGMLDANRRVSLVARDWTVREILRELLGENFAYKSSGRYLIIKKQKPPKSELSGVVRDPKSGERLANVTVYDRKTLRATTTDSSGYYRLRVKNKAEVVVTRLGYRDTVLQVSSLTPRYQRIELAPVLIPVSDTTTLSEKLKKTLQQTAGELEHFFAATLDKWNDVNVPDTLRRRFQLSLLPKIGTNHVLSGKVENDWSVNMLAGQSAGVRGAEVAGLGNFTKNHVRGVQAAGLFNLNRGDCIGVEAAGLFNTNKGNCTGVQAAGLFNQVGDTLNGVQLAGLINTARSSSLFLVQGAGLINYIRKNNGTQNLDTTLVNATKGVQMAGLMNKSDELEGVQAAGLINSAKDIKGVQVSGLVNHARRMRGLQIGIVNNANELHGIQIGIINRSGKRWLPVFNWGK